MTMTFTEAIEEEAGGEILGCVIRGGPRECVEPLSWEEARDLLSYPYVSDRHGFYGPRGHAIYAWTETHLIFVAVHDADVYETRLVSVPRNPQACKPILIRGA